MVQFSFKVCKSLATFICVISLSAVFGFAGQMTDARDGRTYRTIKIGNQEWMAENLNFKTKESLCYEGSDCDTFGRYYRWNEAKGACPAGWHLPVKGELDALLKNGPKYIKDPNGFAMQPAGNFGGQDDIPYHEENSYLWSSTYVDECDGGGELDCSYAYVLRSSHFGISVVEEYFDAVVLYSIRCVKD